MGRSCTVLLYQVVVVGSYVHFVDVIVLMTLLVLVQAMSGVLMMVVLVVVGCCFVDAVKAVHTIPSISIVCFSFPLLSLPLIPSLLQISSSPLQVGFFMFQ